MATVAPPEPLRLSAARLQPFEPVGLGARRAAFERLVGRLKGRTQSEIRQVLGDEVAAIGDPGDDLEAQAYRVALLVLRDYLSAGYFPVVRAQGLWLAPLLDALDDGRRRAFLRRLYAGARLEALRERDHGPWLRRGLGALSDADYEPWAVVDALGAGAPQIDLRQVTATRLPLDERGLWRLVRATWNMAPEMSAPGREVAFLVRDARWPLTPLGILQARNVVPEIRQRDRWLGVTVGTPPAVGIAATGYLRLLAEVDRNGARERITATARQWGTLLDCVQTDGLPAGDLLSADVAVLDRLARQRHDAYHAARRDRHPDPQQHLAVAKRAETARDLLAGLRAAESLLAHPDPVAALGGGGPQARGFELGLRKLWHYHMGFVAYELSVCGAAPPFGPLRLGKLCAALAGADEVVQAWGQERPLGVIASGTFRPEVRERLPSPGPLVVFTSGLFPGHAAQYNRVRCGSHRWRKIGETLGFGSFHVSRSASEAMERFNEQADGYRHITREFGQGSGARFRAIGKALNRVGLPDLRRHEVGRPLYALPLVDDVQGTLLGWRTPAPASTPTAQQLAEQWWQRWVRPDAEALAERAQRSDDLLAALHAILDEVQP